MKNALMLLDTGNLFYNVSKKFPNHRINYANFLKTIPDDFDTVKKIAFGSYREENKRAMSFMFALSKLDFVVRFKKLVDQKFYKPTIDIVIEAYENIDIDCLILGSNNLSLLPLIKKFKERGIKVYVVGCNMPKPFEHIADKIIEINEEFLADEVNNSKE